MKKLTLILSLLLFVAGMYGQTKMLTVPHTVANLGTVDVPVYAKNFTNIGGMNLEINFNAALTYQSVIQQQVPFTVNGAVPNKISLQWFDISNALNASGDSPLFTIRFNYNSGGVPASPVTFNTSASQVIDNNGSPTTIIYRNGSVNPPGTQVATVDIIDTVSRPNNIFSIPVNVKGFSNISAFTLKIKYDNTKLLGDVTALNKIIANINPALSVSNNWQYNVSGGVLSILWYTTGGGVNVADGKLFDILLKNTNVTTSSELEFDVAQCEITNGSGSSLTFVNYLDGTVRRSYRAPQFVNKTPASPIKEKLTYSYQYTAKDDDGDTLAFVLKSIVPTPSVMPTVSQYGTLVWTPAFNDQGSYLVTVGVSDQDSETTTNATVIVIDSNRAPSFTAQLPATATVQEKAKVSLAFATTDADTAVGQSAIDASVLPQVRQSLSYAASILPVPTSGTTPVVNNGKVEWTPGYADQGTYTIKLIVSDNGVPVLSDSSSTTVTVVDSNRVPYFTSLLPATASNKETVKFVLPFAIADTDAVAGQSLPVQGLTTSVAFTGSVIPKSVLLGTNLPVITGTGLNRQVEWTPAYTDAGTYAITVTVSDNGTPVLSATSTSAITVTDSNRVPVISFDPSSSTGLPVKNYSVAQGSTITINVKGIDPDVVIDNTLTFLNVTGFPSNATLVKANDSVATFSWTPTAAQLGVFYPIHLRVTDNHGAFAQDSILINVTANQPSFTVIGASQLPIFGTIIREGQPFKFTYKAIDPQGLPLWYTLASVNGYIAPGAKIDSTSGLFTWTPPVGFGGPISGNGINYAFRVNASNPIITGESNTAYITVKPDHVPTIGISGSKTLNINEETPVNFTVVTDDADKIEGDSVKLAITISPAVTVGTAPVITINTNTNLQNGSFAWTPALGTYKTGRYVVKIVATDLSSVTFTDSVVINVAKKNYAPVFDKKLNDTTFQAGTAFSYTYHATDANSDSVIYRVISPVTGAAITTAGVFTWTPVIPGNYEVIIGASDGTAETKDTAMVVVGGFTVSGSFKYANATNHVITGVTVKILKLDNTLVSTTTTDAQGNYSFPVAFAPGTYMHSYSKESGAEWATGASVNAADALAIARYFVKLDALTTIQQVAADVNNDGLINATDAYGVLRRYVGLDVAYPNGKADWSFKGNADTLVITTQNITNNVLVLATGDVNGSLYTTLAKANSEVLAGSVQKVNAKASFEIPVTANMINDLGSISLKMNYPVELGKLSGIVFNSKLKNVISKTDAAEGTISIAWINDLNSVVKLSDKEVLFTVKFTATDKLQKGTSFALNMDPSSELTTIEGASIAKSSLTAPKVEVSIPEVFSLKQNYPNPFNPSTTIAYDLPVNGHVKLVVMNILGQEVATVLNTVQDAGSYKVVWDASRFSSGVYIYTLSVEGAGQKYVKTNRMILMK